jgi:hypothetical protein
LLEAEAAKPEWLVERIMRDAILMQAAQYYSSADMHEIIIRQGCRRQFLKHKQGQTALSFCAHDPRK